MEMSPEIEILKHNKQFGIFAIRIPVGVRNPRRSDERFELEYERFAFLVESGKGASVGPRADVLRMFNRSVRENKAAQ